MKKPRGTYQIHDTFIITGRGIVFLGEILEGELLIGDTIQFEFEGQLMERIISGTDKGMRVAEGKPKVGIVLRTKNEDEILALRKWKPNLTIAKIYSIEETEIKKEEKTKAGTFISRIINGIVQILLSLFWVFHFGLLFYKYHFTDSLFVFMYPDWALLLFIMMSFIGAAIGFSVSLGKKKIKTGYFQIIGLFLFGLLIQTVIFGP